MATSTTSPRTTPRDPATAIWTIAGVCWAATLLLTFVGGSELGAHDHVLEDSPWPWPARILAFLAVWTVMIGAMMLPTTTAMARLFTAVSANQPHPFPARVAFYATYLVVWGGFALGALAGDTLVHAAVDRSNWLAERTELILAGALLLAGLYQLSPLKDACLRACRSPMSVIGRHYARGLAGGWRVGRSHALNCLGCCWALMLVMFATGVGSLAWMIGLSGVMLAEKTGRYGDQLVPAVALGMLGAGVAMALPALV